MDSKAGVYDPPREPIAIEPHNRSSLAELLLWTRIKEGQLRGYHFLYQQPLEDDIVDFYCSNLRLAIEIDSGSFTVHEDLERQCRLEAQGVRFLRFDDSHVKRDTAGVLRVIENWITIHSSDLTKSESSV